jgi:hypothetical protein
VTVALRRAYRLLGILLVPVLLVGCGRTYADPATLSVSLDPDLVFAALSEATSLSKAATQLATTLNVDPNAVRVRIKPGNCSTCSLAAHPEMASMAGLSVAEAEKLIEPNDEVSFFIPKFSCTFLYDGERFIPQRCQQSPI